MNVLIADRDNLMIRLISSAFREAGFATFIALDVRQATMLVRSQRIDAVVLDMALPGGSGEDVIHRLKLSKRTGNVPVIVVSGSVEPAARERILAMGADDFFEKPADLEKLVESLRGLTSTSRMAPVLAATSTDYLGG
jgi:DNA-binding response OmpR family regulator